ncbi:MAG: tyrosine-type recombinase/integrase [Anaerolineales bacterium]|nr:tyrosine-type recombinase/integrase [Anaerolineales bacterium]
MAETPPLVTNWLEHLDQQGRSTHTLKAYRRAWHHLADWYETHYDDACDPTRLIGRDIRDWKSHQQTIEKAAPSTINQRLVAVSSFYGWAVGVDKVSRDPTKEISTIRLPQRQPKSLSTKQLRQLLRAVHHGGSLRAVAMIELLVGTGLRVGELLQLQVGDLILRDRSGWVTVREGKHGGYREIPLTNEVRQALSAYLDHHPYHQEGHEAYQDSQAPLWWGKHGPLSHRSSVLRILNKYTLRAQLDPIGPHILRHTFATQYLQANPEDLRGLAALLGHSDLNTVMIYTEPTLHDLTGRLERMNRLSVDEVAE